MGKKHLTLIALIFCYSGLTQAKNLPMSNEEVFDRCYTKLFRSVLTSQSTLGTHLHNQIKIKKMTGPEACAILVQQSSFTDFGQQVGPVSKSFPALTEAENQALISNLHAFHNTWFSQRSLEFVSNNRGVSTGVLKDIDEPALHFTRALFARRPVSEVFTLNKTIRGVRSVPGAPTTRWQSKPFDVINQDAYGSANGFKLSYGPANRLNGISIPDDQLVGFGFLIGVEEPAPLVVPEVVISEPTNVDATIRTEVVTQIRAQRENVDLFKHLGGGIVGSQMFLMKNTNLEVDQIAPGPNNDKDEWINRRISSRIFEDLLCQQMPTLTEADVRADVIANSPHGFRQSSTCMQCHSSLDPLAYTLRGLTPYRTATNEFSTDNTIRSAGTPSMGIIQLQPVADARSFTLGSPEGTLRYRDHEQKLVRRNVASIAEIGEALADSDDFYRCVTKRYYKFLTGFDVNLSMTSAQIASASKEAKFHRTKVFKLAANLKRTKNLQMLLRDILASEPFVHRNFTPN